MQFRPSAKEEVVSCFHINIQMTTQQFCLINFLKRSEAKLDVRHPEDVLVVAQPTYAVFYVRFLKVDGFAKLRVAEFLILKSLLNVGGRIFISEVI